MKINTLSFLFFIFLSLYSFSQSTANYDISVTTIWNVSQHSSLPSNAHWSPLAGATHKNPNDILEFGITAPLSNGIKDIAETGSTVNFQNEINTQITAGNANQYLQQGFSPFAGNNSNASLNNITASEDFPLITLVSMVAPSPDWFIAVLGENLRSGNNSINNGWRDSFTMDVFAYDAGTDDGMDYTSGNAVSSPRINISKINGFPVNGNRMATVTFTLKSFTLSNTNNTIENLKIYPNPTNGNITISNIQNIDIKSIDVYNILAKIVKSIPIKSDFLKISINLSNLNKGVYILNIKAVNGSTFSQKLIIN